MTIVVNRPRLDLDFAQRQIDQLQKSIARGLTKVEEYPRRLSTLLDTTSMEFYYRCVLDPAAGYLETWESVTTAEQVGSTIFAAAGRTAGVFEARIAHKIRHIKATGPSPWADAERWLRALWMTMICRERDRTRMLARFPVEELFNRGGESDDFVQPWIEALQTFWRNEPEVFDHLLPAMQATAPERLRVAPKKTALLLYWPVMKAFSYLLEADDSEFNAALAEAVQLHKEFWTADNKLAANSSGFVALAPLAIACLARDRDVPVEVESEYLPVHLVNGEWLGEFPT